MFKMISEKTNLWTPVDPESNIFSNMSDEEIKERLGTLIESPPSTYTPFEFDSNLQGIDLPKEYDVTEERGDICEFKIYDQGRCGSCWAFQATEALEDRVCIPCNGHVNPRVSVQEMVSCNWGSLGCNGGFPWAAWEYMSLLGVVSSECLEYTSGKGDDVPCPYISLLSGACQGHEYKRYYARSFKIIFGEKNMMTEIFLNGPISVGFTVYSDFLSYGNGIYEPLRKVNWLKEFSMDLAKCIFQMEVRKLAFMKIMFLREVKSSRPSQTQTKHFRKSLQFKDRILS